MNSSYTQDAIKKRDCPQWRRLLRRKPISWASFRFIPAVLLLFAATMKALQGPEDQLPTPIFYLDPSLILNATIIIEAFIGIWIIFNFQPQLARLVVLFLFTLFTTISLSRAFAGEKSCGCFGEFVVPPILTAILDLVVIIVSLCCVVESKTKSSSSPIRAKTLRLYSAVIILLSSTTLLLNLNASKQVIPLLSKEQIIPIGTAVLASPQEWINQPFPLIPYSPNADLLENDRWLVLLYNHQCEACKTYATITQKLARLKKLRFAVIDVNASSYSKDEIGAEYHETLSSQMKWIVPYPCAVELNNGIVTRFYDNHSNANTLSIAPETN